MSGFSDRWLSQVSHIRSQARAKNAQAPKPVESERPLGVEAVSTAESEKNESQIVLREKAAKAAKAAKADGPTAEHPLLLPGEPVKGAACWKCGAPVTWRGPLYGIHTLTMEFIHLRCPS